MLKLTVQLSESFNEETNEFLSEDFVLELEHSLVALSKWESEYEKPFLGKDSKTTEEILGYVKTMTLTPEVPEEVFLSLSAENFEEINAYLDKKMTATWVSELPGAAKSNEIITSELIYYWLTVFTIPFEVENWHLNRLFMLIKVANAKNAPAKKQSKAEMVAQRRSLNEQRKAQMGTKG